MRLSPTQRGFKSVMLSEDAHAKLVAVGVPASAAVLRITSRVEQMEADIANLRAELERLQSDGCPSEEWLTAAFGRRRMIGPRYLDERNAWRRIAGLPAEPAEPADE